ncbi:MAG: transcription elongation factor Spt5 [Nanoarchaeota archaeon]|nr:transcription elongation factor Spt5 [Nanoarchaeota archaeon]
MSEKNENKDEEKLKSNDGQDELMDEWARTDAESVKKSEAAEKEQEDEEELIEKKDKKEKKETKESKNLKKQEEESGIKIYALRTTANREDQVMDFVYSNAQKKKLHVYSVIRPHGMRGYIFVEAETRSDAEQAAFNVPYARGILPAPVDYKEIAHMLEQVKVQMNIRKNDIVEIISGPFKREQAKITRIDKSKEDVVVELLESAVPIPITVKMDAVRVIRREEGAEETKEENDEDMETEM